MSEAMIDVVFYAIAFLSGWLARGGIQQWILDGHYAKGKSDGYYEACGILSKAEKASRIRRVK